MALGSTLGSIIIIKAADTTVEVVVAVITDGRVLEGTTRRLADTITEVVTIEGTATRRERSGGGWRRRGCRLRRPDLEHNRKPLVRTETLT